MTAVSSAVLRVCCASVAAGRIALWTSTSIFSDKSSDVAPLSFVCAMHQRLPDAASTAAKSVQRRATATARFSSRRPDEAKARRQAPVWVRHLRLSCVWVFAIVRLRCRSLVVGTTGRLLFGSTLLRGQQLPWVWPIAPITRTGSQDGRCRANADCWHTIHELWT